MNNPAFYTNDFFSIEPCDDCFIPGHLIIRPQKKVNTLTDLPSSALHNLGPTLALCYTVLQETLNPARIYTLSFCEVLPLLHFHVFPRTKILGDAFNLSQGVNSDTVNGALFFDWARKYCAVKGEDYDFWNEQVHKRFYLK